MLCTVQANRKRIASPSSPSDEDDASPSPRKRRNVSLPVDEEEAAEPRAKIPKARASKSPVVSAVRKPKPAGPLKSPGRSLMAARPRTVDPSDSPIPNPVVIAARKSKTPPSRGRL